MIPEYWQLFVDENNLIGKDLEIAEGDDLSDLGAEIRIMTFEQCLSESTKCFPGIAALKDGYIPVGMCLEGSGDYYYINPNDGTSGPLYRIYHDAVVDEKLTNNAVDKVLKNYELLL